MRLWFCGALAVTLAALVQPAADLNDYGPPEYGHGLTEKDALAGWISLFDGKTMFGWVGAKVEDGALGGGSTTSAFGDCEIKADVVRGGSLLAHGKKHRLDPGSFRAESTGRAGAVELAKGSSVRSLAVRPLKLTPLLNGTDLSGWKRIDHPRLPKERYPTWKVEGGALRAVGGPGAVEYQGRPFGDCVIQLEVRTLKRHANGGLFFRSQPGLFMMGYEAQVYNRCVDGDPGKPATWATGAIDDRQNARRLVSRDGVPFVMTVIARGPHLASWVNGQQTTDWTDTRKPHDNPRQGLRVEPGTIQLQAHDAETDVEFRRLAAAALE